MTTMIGVDISKYTLDVQMGERHFQVDNTPQGLSQLNQALIKLSQAGHSIGTVVCEASGGYERGLIEAMREAGWPIHVANAKRVRAFAKSKGYLAKTDKLDAQLIQAYGEAIKVQADEPFGCREQEQLGRLLKRREQLSKDLLREKITSNIVQTQRFSPHSKLIFSGWKKKSLVLRKPGMSNLKPSR